MISKLTLALLISLAISIPEMDELKSLPGWNGTLLSKMYSGYLPAGEVYQNGTHYSSFEHYMFIEAETDPENAPVVVWTNGGPGAASYFGLFGEIGPYHLDERSLATEDFNKTGIPTIFRNEYSWSKVANLLIINNPPPVGYSFCYPAGPSGYFNSCGTHNDSRTAFHSATYLENFAYAFEEFMDNDWYITGESYAGVYIPTLVREILSNKDSLIGR